MRLLGAGRRDHPSGGAGKLRLSGRIDHRHRFAHAQRRGARRLCGRRWRRRRGRGDLRPAVGSALSQAHRGVSDRQARRLGRAQGRDPLRGRPTHGIGRHQCHRRVYRPRRARHQCDRQGHDRQYGRRARRNDLDVSGRRADGDLSARDRPRLHGAAHATASGPAGAGRGGRGRSRGALRPRDQARSERTRAACRRAAFARPRASHLQICRRGRG